MKDAHDSLLKASREVMELIDSKWLVRNTDGDEATDWYVEAARGVTMLIRFRDAIRAFEPEK